MDLLSGIAGLRSLKMTFWRPFCHRCHSDAQMLALFRYQPMQNLVLFGATHCFAVVHGTRNDMIDPTIWNRICERVWCYGFDGLYIGSGFL